MTLQSGFDHALLEIPPHPRKFTEQPTTDWAMAISTGSEHLHKYVEVEHLSVQDLLDLDCEIPQARRLYDIPIANPPPKKVSGQNAAGDNSREWRCDRSSAARKRRLIDEIWEPLPELDAYRSRSD